MFDQRGGEVAGATKLVDRGALIVLRELGARGVEDQPGVSVLRRLVSERASEQDLARRAVQVLVAAQDQIDAHRRVVDGGREVRGRRAARLADDEVGDRRVVEGDVALDAVVDDRRPGRDPEPDRTVALVRGAALEQHRDVGAMDRGSFRLAVGCRRTAELRTLVPRQTQPPEVAQHRRFAPHRPDGVVGVVEAYDEPAPRLPREEPVEERRSGGSDVQRPRRRGREPHPERTVEVHGGHQWIDMPRGGTFPRRRCGPGLRVLVVAVFFGFVGRRCGRRLFAGERSPRRLVQREDGRTIEEFKHSDRALRAPTGKTMR